mgnify:CR=1 FL=1
MILRFHQFVSMPLLPSYLFLVKSSPKFASWEYKSGIEEKVELKHNGGLPSKNSHMSIEWLKTSKQTGKWYEDPRSCRTIKVQSNDGKNESFASHNKLNVYLCSIGWKAKPRSFLCNHVHTFNLRTSATNETQIVCLKHPWLNVVM